MVDLMLLSPSLIDRMLRDERFFQFSFIKNPPRGADATRAVRRAGCGSCGMRKRRLLATKEAQAKITGPIDYNAIKRLIATTAKENQGVIKALLGCKQLTIRYASPNIGTKTTCI